MEQASLTASLSLKLHVVVERMSMQGECGERLRRPEKNASTANMRNTGRLYKHTFSIILVRQKMTKQSLLFAAIFFGAPSQLVDGSFFLQRLGCKYLLI